jgi:hypothetical protein
VNADVNRLLNSPEIADALTGRACSHGRLTAALEQLTKSDLERWTIVAHREDPAGLIGRIGRRRVEHAQRVVK